MRNSAYEPPERIIWDDPGPVRTKQGSKWDPVAKTLKNNPGRWACLGRDMPTAIVTIIRQGKIKCFAPGGSFEAVTRNHSDRWRGDVYARYVGENKEHA